MCGLLAKSRELGPRPQTGSRFTHFVGRSVRPDGYPKNLIIVAFRGYSKISPHCGKNLCFVDNRIFFLVLGLETMPSGAQKGGPRI